VRPLLTKSQRIVVTFGAWVFLALAILTVFQSLSFEYIFVLCLIGFLVIVELSGPFASRPRWRSRVNVVILLGVIVFSLIVLEKVLDILGIRLI
jgi:4-amino-4-deoxy-L-arabinose transferase-like glycosyltransferase